MSYKIEVDGVEVEVLSKAKASVLVHDPIPLDPVPPIEPEDDGS